MNAMPDREEARREYHRQWIAAHPNYEKNLRAATPERFKAIRDRYRNSLTRYASIGRALEAIPGWTDIWADADLWPVLVEDIEAAVARIVAMGSDATAT